MRQKLLTWIRNLMFLVVMTLVALFFVNLVAYWIFEGIRIKGGGLNNSEYFISPLSPDGQQVLKSHLPPEQFETALQLLGNDPGFRPHPVLGFTEAFSRPGYHIGLESIRYQEGWSDEQVQTWLHEPNRHPYVFGGSTAFGHGVSSDQTVAAELGRIDGGSVYLNFSIQAYDSIREVDRLLLLLRQGFRPARVIFIDGLNDLTTFAWSPYRALEKPRMQTFITDRGEVSLTFGHPRNRNMLQAFAFAFPAVQLIRHWQWQSRFRDFKYQPRRADLDPLDWQELMFYYQTWQHFQPERSAEFAREWIHYYRQNVEFIRSLGQAFGFKSTFVLQPIGLATQGNPFLRPSFLDSAVYRLYANFQAELQKAAADGQLDVLDCTRALDESVAESYIDLAHYSALGNRLLAECISAGGLD